MPTEYAQRPVEHMVSEIFSCESQLERVRSILLAALVHWEDKRTGTELPPWVIQARAALGRVPG